MSTSLPSPPTRARGARPARWIAGFAVLAVLLQLPFLGTRAGRDEAGYLMVGAGWGHGDEVYGRYWVDRPPLLVWIFEVAGDLTTLRLLGCVAAAATVVLVGAAANAASGARAGIWAAGCAALVMSQPWLGTVRVNGETLAAPFSAAALLATVLVVCRGGKWWMAAVAGSAATLGVLVKQSTVDAAVFVVVAFVVAAWRGFRPRRELVPLAAGVVGGVLVTLVVATAFAAARGTGPAELFDAVVWFRVEAGETIRASATDATTQRLVVLIGTWLVSGLSVLTLAVLALAARRRDAITLATAAGLIAATAFALMGGSYWAHYLIALVPTAAFGAGLVADAVSPRWRLAGAGLILAATTATVGHTMIAPGGAGLQAQVVGRAIKDSAEAGDTIVVAYGQPNVLHHAGLESPYPYLWSLPVRSLDPDLDQLSDVLEGADAPTWVVNWSGFDDWGVDASRLMDVVERRYRSLGRICGREVWLDRRVERASLDPEGCG